MIVGRYCPKGLIISPHFCNNQATPLLLEMAQIAHILKPMTRNFCRILGPSAKRLMHSAAKLWFAALSASVLAQSTNLPRSSVNDGKAEYELAKQCFHGSGMPRDLSAGVEHLRVAANLGYAYAQTELAGCLAKGTGVSQNWDEAVKWYRKAAAQQDPLAVYALGNLYFHGQGVAEDKVEALGWWRRAADLGLAMAQNELGQFYFQIATEDRTNAADYVKSVKWLRKAAEQGYVPSMNNLAYQYENGLGTDLDPKEAHHWYQAAAEKGSAKAQSNLGLMYQEGTVVPQDFVQAYKWFKLAAMQNDAVGRRYVLDYDDAHRLTDDQHEEVNRMIAQFRSQMRTNRSVR